MRQILKLCFLAMLCCPATGLAQPTPQGPADLNAMADAHKRRMLREFGENIGLDVLNTVGGADPSGVSGMALSKFQESIIKSRNQEAQRFDDELERAVQENDAYIERQIEAHAAQHAAQTGAKTKKVKARQTSSRRRTP